MIQADLNTGLGLLANGGFCLWIGSGVGSHLASIGRNSRRVGWGDLVARLELAAEVTPPSETPYIERLEVCQRRLGIQKFQQVLRETVHSALRDSLIDAARERVDQHDLIPKQVRQIARLGVLPNPIVNFNIELWTSWTIAGGGPFVIRTFVPNEAQGPFDSLYRYGRIQEHFARNIYHPHGAVEASGRCVLTLSEYRRLSGTLAFQLAVHQSFQSDLAIVGMSLEDSYLREQLTEFRDQIKNLIWFTDCEPSTRPELHRWVWLVLVQTEEESR